VRFFIDIYRRRTQDLSAEHLVPVPLCEELAYYSGGRARGFIRMMRDLAMKAWHVERPAATKALIQEVIDDERRLLETGMHTGHIKLLQSVVADSDHRLPQDGLVWELLRTSRLLPYPNESEWFYPHPLLTMHLLRTGSRG
jgi:hypothetical protein